MVDLGSSVELAAWEAWSGGGLFIRETVPFFCLGIVHNIIVNIYLLVQRVLIKGGAEAS